MKFVVGIDEAGRGPLAGPVAVGVVVVPGNFLWDKKLPGVNDSKQLTEKKREDIFTAARKLKASAQLDFTVSMVSAKIIDEIGIVPAINLAMSRALKKLKLDTDRCRILLDGGLKAPVEFVCQETIIKGDSKEKVIGLASIMAKVTRDRYMVRKSSQKIFAPYDFTAHKGYGTQKHRQMITQNGFSSEHRVSFCTNIKIS